MAFHYPEEYRIRKGAVASQPAEDGVFWIPPVFGNAYPLQAHAVVAECWEHVAVVPAIVRRCPTWEEMVLAKGLFWDLEDCVVQFHPRASQYVNSHPYCLHLWRPTEGDLPQPAKHLVCLDRLVTNQLCGVVR